MTGHLANMAKYILENSASFGDWLVKLRDTIKSNDVFANAMAIIVKIISTGFAKATGYIQGFIEGIKSVGAYIKENLDFSGFESIHKGLEIMYKRICSIDDAAKGAGKAVFGSIVSLDWSPLLKVVQHVIDAVKAIWNGIATALDKLDYNEVIDIINSGLFATLLKAIRDFFKEAKNSISDISGVFTGITEMLGEVKETLVAYQNDLKAGTLLKIASAIALLAGSLMLISLIDSDKISSALGAITVLIGDLLGSLYFVTYSINKMGKGTMKYGTVSIIAMMIGISASVFILAGALKKVSDLDTDQIITGLAGIFGMSAALMLMMANMSVFGKEAIKGAGGLILVAVAVKILASACIDLASLNFQEIVTGLSGVGILLAEVAGFLFLAKFGGGLPVKTAMGILIVSAAIKVLVTAVKDFGSMNIAEIGKGLVSIAVLLAALGLFANGAGKADHIISTGIALIAIGAAMKIFASAVKDFGGASVEELAKGLIAMAVALAAVALAVNFMPANMLSISVGMIAVGLALKVIASAVKDLGTMSIADLAKGLVALGVSLAILVVGLNAMTGALPGAGALIVAAAAIMILAPAIAFLGAMDLWSIIKALLAIAGAFAILGVAAYVLAPLTPIIAALCGSLALLGLGMALVGVGVTAIGTGLTAIAAGLTALIAVLPAGTVVIVAALKEVVVGLLGIIKTVLTKFGDILVALCKVVIEAAPAIAEAVKELVLAAITVLTECIAPAVDGLLQFVAQLLTSLADYTPQIVDGLFQFILGLLQGLTKYIPDLVVVLMEVLGAVFQGVIDALSIIDGAGLLGAIVTIGLVEAIVVSLSLISGFIPGAMVALAGLGLMAVELAAILAILGGLAQIPGLEWLIGEGGDFLQKIGTAIGQFVGGIIGGIAEGATSTLPKVGENLSAFMENASGFITGMQNVDAGLAEKVGVLCDSILKLVGADLVSSLASLFTGDSSLSDLGKKMAKFGGYIKEYAASISSVNTGAVSTAISEVKKLMNLAKDASGIDFDSLSDFGEALGDMAEDGIKKFVKAFKNAHEEVSDASDGFVNELIKAFNNRTEDVSAAGEALVTASANAVRGQGMSFYNAGAFLVTGFCSGITQNIYKAKAKAKAMAGAAAEAARKELDEHSPSRVGYEIGDYFGIAFVNGISDNIKGAYRVSKDMATYARTGLSKAISRISEFIESDLDTQPTIRPVLDLSNVSSGVRSMNGMLDMSSSVGVLANVGSISRMMDSRQNGNGDVVSAIDKLSRSLGNMPSGDTYNINGVTYSDDSTINAAVQTLVRAVIMDGRA